MRSLDIFLVSVAVAVNWTGATTIPQTTTLGATTERIIFDVKTPVSSTTTATPATTTTTATPTTIPPTFPYFACDGYSEGRTWTTEPCVTCACYDGMKTCYAQTCGPANCPSPISIGVCCPYCPDGDVTTTTPTLSTTTATTTTTVTPTTVTQGSSCDGYPEGHTWKPQPCETCTCDDGMKICWLPSCVPVDCPAPISNGTCCPYCPDDNVTSIPPSSTVTATTTTTEPPGVTHDLLCEITPCENGGTCRNYLYGICDCPTGFSGDLCEYVVTSTTTTTPSSAPVTHDLLCEIVPCENGGTCLNYGPGICDCPTGFGGDLCEQTTTPVITSTTPSQTTTPLLVIDYICDFFPCSNGGTCQENDQGERVCFCPPGYSGELCDETTTPVITSTTPSQTTTPLIVIDYICDFFPCSNGGTCQENDQGERVCFCPPGYSGELCDVHTTTPPPTTIPITTPTSTPYADYLCDFEDCRNGGICGENIFGERVCFCHPGYSGELCEVASPCDFKPCRNGGICEENESAGIVCSCPPGYSGELCEYFHPCEAFGCENGGTCDADEFGSVLCFCQPGFNGEFCEVHYRESTQVDDSWVVPLLLGVLLVAVLLLLMMLVGWYYRRHISRFELSSPQSTESAEKDFVTKAC